MFRAPRPMEQNGSKATMGKRLNPLSSVNQSIMVVAAIQSHRYWYYQKSRLRTNFIIVYLLGIKLGSNIVTRFFLMSKEVRSIWIENSNFFIMGLLKPCNKHISPLLKCNNWQKFKSKIILFFLVLNSSELNAQVSFSDHFFSSVSVSSCPFADFLHFLTSFFRTTAIISTKRSTL